VNVASVNGKFPAVCIDVIHNRENLGFGVKDYVTLVFAVNATGRENTHATRKIAATMTPGSALRHLLEQWRGKPFTTDEADAFDVDNCVGVGGWARVRSHRSNSGRIYVNVQELSPIAKQDVPAMPADYIRQHHRQSVA
jgi:hypothetical protein